MSDEIMLTIGEDGTASLYDDTYDITIHCESQEEQDEVKRILQNVPHWIPVTEEEMFKAGYEGREIRFRVDGRLFAIRELAQ